MAPLQPQLFNPELAKAARELNDSFSKSKGSKARGRATSSRAPSAAPPRGASIRESGLIRAGLTQNNTAPRVSSNPTFNVVPPTPPRGNDNHHSAALPSNAAAKRVIANGINKPPLPAKTSAATKAGTPAPHELAAAKAAEAARVAEQNQSRQVEDEKREEMAGYGSKGAAAMLAAYTKLQAEKAAAANSATNDNAQAKAAEDARKAKAAADAEATAEAEKARKAHLATQEKLAEEKLAQEKPAQEKKLAQEEKLAQDKAAKEKAANEVRSTGVPEANKKAAAAGIAELQAMRKAMSEAAMKNEEETRFKQEISAADKIKRERNDSPISVVRTTQPNSFILNKEGKPVATAKITSIQRLDTTTANVVSTASNALATTPTRARPSEADLAAPLPNEADLLNGMADLAKEKKMLEDVLKAIKRKLAIVLEHIDVKHAQIAQWQEHQALLARMPGESGDA